MVRWCIVFVISFSHLILEVRVYNITTYSTKLIKSYLIVAIEWVSWPYSNTASHLWSCQEIEGLFWLDKSCKALDLHIVTSFVNRLVIPLVLCSIKQSFCATCVPLILQMRKFVSVFISYLFTSQSLRQFRRKAVYV